MWFEKNMLKELNFFILMASQKWRNITIITILCLVFVDIVNATEKFKLDTIVEDVPRKALIIKHDAKLFSNPIGKTAKEAPFMQLFFLMTPDKNFLEKMYGFVFSEKKYNRVPVLNNFSKNKKQPDGWLEKNSFVEWNTVQMINFTPQKDRQLVKIHKTKDCATDFGRTGHTGECQELGEEPQLSSKRKRQYKFLVPLFQREKGIYQGGFVRVYQ
jgi:hypothetical protein